jgi:uncharacterized protein (DUF488 family)
MRYPQTVLHPVSTSLLFTLGYEGRSIDEYCDELLSRHIQVVVDVRKNPISRKKGFSKSSLSAALAASGIAYIHIPSLGIESSFRHNLDDLASYQKLFDMYKSKILPNAKDGIDELAQVLEGFSSVALTCFERDPNYCHRKCVSDFFYNKGLITEPAIHI